VDTFLAIASKRDWRSYADRPIPAEVETRILEAGRLTGSAMNRQPWTLVVVESDERKQQVAETVYAAANIQGAALVIAVVTPGGGSPIDVGRAMQNMMLAAWNDGVASCPNGMPDPAATAGALDLEGDLQPVNVLSFGYPRRPIDTEKTSADEWAREANRRSLDEVVRRA
jgi:nitroreductase